MINNKSYVIHAGWLQDEIIGHLTVTQKNYREYSVFEYVPSWLEKHTDVFLDPELFPTLEPQESTNDIFHFLEDVSPNLWGKILIHKFCWNLPYFPKYPTDYLVLSSDSSRVGGIRIEDNNELVSTCNLYATIDSLEVLQNTARMVEEKNQEIDVNAFDLLYESASSLGGVRPKASVIDNLGDSWIAKFSSIKDSFSVEQWEMITHDLAELCGLKVPKAKLLHVGDNYIYLIKRFDRDKKQRLHFASAMTFLNGKEGEHNITFLDLVSTISTHSVNPIQDSQELWRRIVFSVLVSNKDSYLRDYGFLLKPDGWHLSPMYDVVPNPYKGYMSLPICVGNGKADISLIIKTAPYYSIKNPMEEIQHMKSIIQENYLLLADKYEIPIKELHEMASCFEL